MTSERVITVEYLEPSMSKELLCKFPDNSTFDFDYSQSGIWSPLIPRRRGPDLFSGNSPPRKRRRLAAGSPVASWLFREETQLSLFCGEPSTSNTNMNSNSSNASYIPLLKSTKMKMKGWGKVLKAASKHFKRPRGFSNIRLSVF